MFTDVTNLPQFSAQFSPFALRGRQFFESGMGFVLWVNCG